jgi:hypothetical protein
VRDGILRAVRGTTEEEVMTETQTIRSENWMDDTNICAYRTASSGLLSRNAAVAKLSGDTAIDFVTEYPRIGLPRTWSRQNFLAGVDLESD